MQIDVNYFGLRETTALGFKRWRYLAVIQGNLRVESKVTMGVDSLTKEAFNIPVSGSANHSVCGQPRKLFLPGCVGRTIGVTMLVGRGGRSTAWPLL